MGRRVGKLAQRIADNEVRTVIEVYARKEGSWYNTQRSVDGDQATAEQRQDVELLAAAVKYIDLRGDALGYLMERQPGQPHLVRFKPMGART